MLEKQRIRNETDKINDGYKKYLTKNWRRR